MTHRTGTDRSQLMLIPTCLDDLIGGDSPVRLVDAFVKAVDLESHGFGQVRTRERGAPPYHPAPLLKLYLYGYLNRIRSSRQLEKACHINIEVKWLMQDLQPSHTTIADFRKRHPKPLKEVFRTYNRFLRSEGLFGKEMVAVDGSKFRAQNAMKNNYTEDKIERHIEYIDRQLEQYIHDLDSADTEETQPLPPETETRVAGAVKKLMLRHFKYTGLKKQLEQSGNSQVSTTDPDARALPLHRNIVEVGYNVQTATDGKHNLVVHFEVTNENDQYALSPTATAARQELGLSRQESLAVLADKGYPTGSELAKCAENNIVTYVAPRETAAKPAEGRYSKDDFAYNGSGGHYICPHNERLTTNGAWYEKNSRRKGHKPYRFQRYTISFATCGVCPLRERCLSKSLQKYRQGRYIERSEFEDYIVANRKRVEANRELYRRRQAIVEHPFGTIKRQWGYSFTLLKTLKKVEGDFALIFTAYNLRRSMSLLGVKPLINKLKGLKNSLKSCFFHSSRLVAARGAPHRHCARRRFELPSCCPCGFRAIWERIV